MSSLDIGVETARVATAWLTWLERMLASGPAAMMQTSGAWRTSSGAMRACGLGDARPAVLFRRLLSTPLGAPAPAVPTVRSASAKLSRARKCAAAFGDPGMMFTGEMWGGANFGGR